MTLWPKIALVLAVELAALAAMVADKQWTLSHGTPVILKTAPLDPRALFMGDYVRLNYEISNLPLRGDQAVGGDKTFRRHDTVWVALEPHPDGARVRSVHHRCEAVPAGLIALKGEAEDRVSGDSIRHDRLQVRYGIEQYFVAEGSGRQIERLAGQVSLRIAIDSRGQAGIQAVLLDGKTLYRETLF